ncbi:MAG: Gfo/Idh/MocA family oxidoreductase, partial [Pseudomonadota bacterium]|nr:Gfo/Idh/MocA family oxidoreductase [Pseudomonadota bacterium]
VADEFGIARVTDNWMDVVNDETIDAVCIGTWPYMHAPMTIAALNAGKHVLCEARMAMNATEARSMLAASRRNPTKVAQIVTAPHSLKFDNTIIGMISDGAIGELIALDARVTAGSSFPNYDAPVHWRHDRDLSGNNIMAMGIWYECMMRWVGPAKTVHAIGQAVVPHRKDENGRRHPMTIPDHLDVIGKLESGGQMRFSISSVSGHAPTNADVYLFGTEGTLLLQMDKSGNFTLYAGSRNDDGLSEVIIEPAKASGWRVEEEFVNAIRGQEIVTHTDFVTGVQYMDWTDAVSRSVREGVAVTLP